MTDFQGTYHLPLVFLSLIISVFTSSSVLYLYEKISVLPPGQAKRLWLAFGSAAVGLGLWSMHFIGILAFRMPHGVRYDAVLMAVSIVLPIVAAYAALSTINGRFKKHGSFTIGGLIMGSAFAGMHYAGMAAMETPVRLHFNWPTVGLSVLIAYAISFAALKMSSIYLRQQNRFGSRTKAEASLLFGFAIAGMHYTGLEAVRFDVNPTAAGVSMYSDLKESELGIWIGGAAILIMALLLLSQAVDKRLALRHAESNQRRYDTIFEHNPDMVCLFDKNGQLMRANPAAERLTGYPVSRLLRRAYLRILCDEDAVRLREAIDYALRGFSRTIELKVLHMSGREVQLSMTMVPLLENGTVQDVYSISKDITDAKRAESELLEAKKEAEEALRIKSDFLAVMSHEIRTPLNGVIGMSEIMMETKLDEQQKQYLEVIQGAGEALLAVINDVLDFSKIESGKLKIVPQPFDLKAMLHDTVRVFTAQIGQKQLYVQWDVDHDVPDIVVGDETRIRQILLNLVANAVKFTDEGGIQIAVSKAAGADMSGIAAATPGCREIELAFVVTDTGIGIRLDEQPSLFQPFYQAESSAGRGHRGTGLGLAICKTLVELMNGSISVSSEPGVGTCFSFTIRVQSAQSGAGAHPAGLWEGDMMIS